MTPAPIRGPYFQDLQAQPEVLRWLVERLERAVNPWPAPAREFGRVVLTGMGSSWYAQYPLHLALHRCGLSSSWVETSELLLGYESLYRTDTLVVAVSQSGESAEIVNLLKRRQEFGAILGVTNAPESTLGRNATSTWLLHAGQEATVSCKTYLATLALLHVLSAALTGGQVTQALADLRGIIPFVTNYLRNVDAHVGAMAGAVSGVRSVFVTGRGASLATAGTGGLILKESTRRHAEGMSAAGFRHGPLEMVGADVQVLVCAGGPSVAGLHRRLVSDIIQAGGRAALIGAGDDVEEVFKVPEVPASLLPLVEILPVQMLSLALAARDGIEAGRFQRASKITTQE